MRARPIRPNIYLPVVRFGVADSDWFSVLLISCAGYLAPVPFGITVFYVPLQMWTWLLATAGSIAFFNYIRIGKRPHWLHHKLKALFRHHRQYRALPNGRKRPFSRTWMVEPDDPNSLPEIIERVPLALELVSYNTQLQEVTWNPALPLTN